MTNNLLDAIFNLFYYVIEMQFEILLSLNFIVNIDTCFVLYFYWNRSCGLSGSGFEYDLNTIFDLWDAQRLIAAEEYKLEE